MSMHNTHALGRLIEGIKDANGWSYEDLAKRAERAGHSISRQNIQRIVSEPVRTISTKQLHALADATGTRADTIAIAALRSAGIPIADEPESLERALQDDAGLPEHIKDAILGLIAPYRRGADVVRLPERHIVDSAAYDPDEPRPGE